MRENGGSLHRFWRAKMHRSRTRFETWYPRSVLVKKRRSLSGETCSAIVSGYMPALGFSMFGSLASVPKI